MPHLLSLKYRKLTEGISYVIVEAHPHYSHTLLGTDVVLGCVCVAAHWLQMCSNLYPQLVSVSTLRKRRKFKNKVGGGGGILCVNVSDMNHSRSGERGEE